MEPPELTNFGSLVRFALELEASTAAFYAAAADRLGPGRQGQMASSLAALHEERRRLLERTRQQKLNEMVLEPIMGLDGRRYVYDATLMTADEAPRKGAALERIAVLLYSESATVAQSLLTEAARTFRKLAEENERNLQLLRETFPA